MFKTSKYYSFFILRCMKHMASWNCEIQQQNYFIVGENDSLVIFYKGLSTQDNVLKLNTLSGVNFINSKIISICVHASLTIVTMLSGFNLHVFIYQVAQLRKIMLLEKGSTTGKVKAVGMNYRPVQPLSGRTVYHTGSASMVVPSIFLFVLVILSKLFE